MPTFDEELAEINAATLEQVKSFYTRFVGGANAELAIVGDFDPDAIRALATELFGAWTSPAPFARVPNPYRPPAPTVLTGETPDKANATLIGPPAAADQRPQRRPAGADRRRPDPRRVARIADSRTACASARA